MLNHMRVKTIGLQLFFSLKDRKLLGRCELQKKSFHLAVRAVALDNGLRKVEFNLVPNIPAVAGTFVCFHGSTIPPPYSPQECV